MLRKQIGAQEIHEPMKTVHQRVAVLHAIGYVQKQLMEVDGLSIDLARSDDLHPDQRAGDGFPHVWILQSSSDLCAKVCPVHSLAAAQKMLINRNNRCLVQAVALVPDPVLVGRTALMAGNDPGDETGDGSADERYGDVHPRSIQHIRMGPLERPVTLTSGRK
ncbi:MAG: hypothetical protein AVDCRST_MAG57-1818 [uncultured Blastococcus sp.]|uniref:Uncharacterized protein n=1 Tax=uncultured Blastococcus sp. TaxID=217144 RepID=A0A6J4IBK9_9ACTN|nr:MAG: hypothetical protein AVDCRST_MAG57-1818 [uncultured Blastococcus sp.]